jgi:hypothetical protein
VFLSYSDLDKPAVVAIAEALRERGLRVWFDEWELVPGQPWQEALEAIVTTVRAAVVFVGPSGVGPWEDPEMRACLTQLVERRLPVIPVLLPAAPGPPPDLPRFLHVLTWGDLRPQITEAGLGQLEWAITGVKPSGVSSAAGPTPDQLSDLPGTPRQSPFPRSRSDSVGEPVTSYGHRSIGDLERRSFSLPPGQSLALDLNVARWNELIGPFFREDQAAALLGGISREELASMFLRRELLALSTVDGMEVFPAFQFDGRRKVLPGLSEVLRILSEASIDDWTLAGWLVAPSRALEGNSVVDWLRADRAIEPAVALARDAVRRFAR